MYTVTKWWPKRSQPKEETEVDELGAVAAARDFDATMERSSIHSIEYNVAYWKNADGSYHYITDDKGDILTPAQVRALYNDYPEVL